MMRKTILLLATLALASCAVPGIDIPEPVQVLNVAMVGSFDSLEPASANPPPPEFIRQVYETLTLYDENMNAAPNLAKSWDIGDGQITFHLDDRKFSDDSKLTAQDVADSLSALATTDSSWIVKNIPGFTLFSQGRSASIDGVEVADETTLVIKTHDAPEHFLKKLASPYASVWKNGERFPLGTGAFAIKKYVQDIKVILEPNPHFPKKPTLSQVNFQIRNTSETAYEDLRQGRIEITGIGENLVDDARNEAGMKLVVIAEPASISVGFNCKSVKFSRAENRTAVVSSINPSKINAEVWNGFHKPESAKPKKTKPDFTSMEITIPSLLGKKFGQSLKSQIEAGLGVKVTIKILSQDEYISALSSGKAECFVFGSIQNTPDRYDFLSLPVSTDIIKSALGYAPEQYLGLLKESTQKAGNSRDSVLESLTQMIDADCPYAKIFEINGATAVSDNVSGYNPKTFAPSDFAMVSIRR